MDNRYLRDRADRRRGRMGRDRAYGDSRRSRDYRGGYDRTMDSRNDYSEYDSRYDSRDYADYRRQDSHYGSQRYGEHHRPMEYEMYGVGTISSPYDHRSDYARDYRGDMGDYSDEDMEKEYHEDLKELTEKLKKKDRFGLPHEEIIKRAKQKGVNFSKYEEDEFVAVYYMMISDYKTIANDPMTYIHLAKEWLEDDDVAVSPSEKLCIYLYKIIKGE